MELYSTYIETDKFDEVVNFYEKVFEKKGSIYTKNRWIELLRKHCKCVISRVVWSFSA